VWICEVCVISDTADKLVAVITVDDGGMKRLYCCRVADTGGIGVDDEEEEEGRYLGKRLAAVAAMAAVLCS